jgi:hypothetical protein
MLGYCLRWLRSFVGLDGLYKDVTLQYAVTRSLQIIAYSPLLSFESVYCLQLKSVSNKLFTVPSFLLLLLFSTKQPSYMNCRSSYMFGKYEGKSVSKANVNIASTQFIAER